MSALATKPTEVSSFLSTLSPVVANETSPGLAPLQHSVIMLTAEIGFIFVAQWVGWAVSMIKKTEKFYDFTGSLTHIVVVVSALAAMDFNSRRFIQGCCVIVWASRLGFYLFRRIRNSGTDRRFDGVREKPHIFLLYWTMQGVWITNNLLPTLLLLSSTSLPPLRSTDYIGWPLWLIGFIIEAVADRQKDLFRADPNNEGKFINTGLWKYSQHPNFLGELIMWFSLLLPASAAFNSAWAYCSIVCPFLTAVLLIKISGIPPLERYAKQKWGNDPEFLNYYRSTAKLVPFLC